MKISNLIPEMSSKQNWIKAKKKDAENDPTTIALKDGFSNNLKLVLAPVNCHSY